MEDKKFRSNEKYFTIAIYSIIVFTAACIIFQLIIHGSATLKVIQQFLSHMYSFVIGLLIAFMVNPLVKYVYDKILKQSFKIKSDKMCKLLSILLSYVVVLGFIIVCLIYVIPQLINSISELSTSIPLIYSSFSRWIRTFSYYNSHVDNSMVNNILSTITPKIMEFSTNLASQIIPLLYSVSMSIVHWFVTIVFALVISIYLISDKQIIIHAFKKMLYAFLRKDTANEVIEITKNCNEIFTGYMIAKSIDSLIIGILCFIVLALFNMPYALLISVIVGVTNMIPYFGPYIGAVPGILLLTITKIRYGIEFTVIVLILQQFDGLILGPRLLGDSTGVRPILILFAIIFGGAYFGVIGMFLGVPVIAVIQYLIVLFVDARLKAKNITDIE